MPTLLTLTQVRELVQDTVNELSAWFVAKPRLFAVARPAQQIQFELSVRLRERLREMTGNPRWDRLYFDGSDVAVLGQENQLPPVYIDTRQLYGVVGTKERTAAEPDLALAVHVLRTVDRSIEYDDDGNVVGGAWAPVSMRGQGALLDQRVDLLERLSRNACDGTLLVIYSNEARRKSAVDLREVASWAAWQKPLDTLWWGVRHFRAKAR